MDVDPALALVDFVASDYFHFDLFLLSISFEISMINSDSLVDLMVVGSLQISWVRLFSIAHGLKVLFISEFILQVK